jgi:hypothetical protein
VDVVAGCQPVPMVDIVCIVVSPAAASLPADAADVHSPGVPRDCAALEGLDEPDLTALAAAASRHTAAGGTSGSSGTVEDVAHRTGGSADAAAGDMTAALSRLQEVRCHALPLCCLMAIYPQELLPLHAQCVLSAVVVCSRFQPACGVLSTST